LNVCKLTFLKGSLLIYSGISYEIIYHTQLPTLNRNTTAVAGINTNYCFVKSAA